MNQSESFVDFFCPWYDGQSSIDIKFLNYSGNVYCIYINVSIKDEFQNQTYLDTWFQCVQFSNPLKKIQSFINMLFMWVFIGFVIILVGLDQ